MLLFAITSTSNNNANHVLLSVCGTTLPKNLLSFYVNYATVVNLVYSKVTSSGFGFASVTRDGNSVYGLSQCFNYLSSIECELCFGSSNSVADLCLPADDRIYLDGCFIRYADHNFLDSAIDGSDTSLCSNSSVAASNLTLFKDRVTELMTNLTLGAEKDGEYYMVGSVEAALGLTVYGMAQCWRSLNASGCRDCLMTERERVSRCLPATDGKALDAGCFVRYSTLPFYMENATESRGNSGRHRRTIVLGAIFGVLVVFGVAVFWIRRVASVATNGQDGSEQIIISIAASSLCFKYEDLKEATDNFNEANKLGQGGYGAVFKAVQADDKVIAVKRLFFNTRQRADQFFKEVNLVNQIQHKNLVRLLGCSIEGPESLLVYEYLCNNSLEKFLYDAFKKQSLDWEKRFEIIVGTAEGLAYLHNSSDVRIIHRDIKPSNILLDERFKPKIADFGLARYFAEDQTHLSTGLAGTLGYMASEYIVHGQLTEKADVYSFGILVIEIITGRKNQNSISLSTNVHSLMSMVWEQFKSKRVIELLDDHLQGQCSDEEALNVFHVGLLYTQTSPTLRPAMWKVVEMLTGRSTELPPPTEPPFTNIKGADINSEGSLVSENQMPLSTVQGR